MVTESLFINYAEISFVFSDTYSAYIIMTYSSTDTNFNFKPK